MRGKRLVPHFQQVDLSRIEAVFFQHRSHRALLRVPLLQRANARPLCVIGQNPSAADERHADRTIRYVEEYIWRRHPEYSELVILNLYSRVDTGKAATGNVLDTRCRRIFEREVRAHREFLLIFGRLQNRRVYRFRDRLQEVRRLLQGKTLYKLDIGTHYAPHPGNRRIHYHNFNLRLGRYDFSELDT